MQVLLVHNHYKQSGGEDNVFFAESKLLEQHGHRVYHCTAHNDDVDELGKLRLAKTTIWNSDSYRAVRALLKQIRPNVMHVHNTLPLLSPSVYYAAKDEGVPVVQTLHNYRFLCPGVYFFRNGKVCEDCMGKVLPWPAIWHGCYQKSRAATAAVASMLSFHRWRGTYRERVDAYICMTEFGRRKFIEGGFPTERIYIKPHFIAPDPGIGGGKGGYALFVGRVIPIKGISTLLEAWHELGRDIPLLVVGQGELADQVEKAAATQQGITWLGPRSRAEVMALMAEATFLVVPSEWYETFGLVAMEAFARGTPVIASKIGAIAEVVEDGHTGLHFRPGDPDDLRDKVMELLSDDARLAEMRKAARAEYEAKYTPEKNYQQLMAIYERAMENHERSKAG